MRERGRGGGMELGECFKPIRQQGSVGTSPGALSRRVDDAQGMSGMNDGRGR